MCSDRISKNLAKTQLQTKMLLQNESCNCFATLQKLELVCFETKVKAFFNVEVLPTAGLHLSVWHCKFATCGGIAIVMKSAKESFAVPCGKSLASHKLH